MAERQAQDGHGSRLQASFGRRRGRPLRVTRAGLMDSLLPQLLVPLPETGPLDPAALFPAQQEYWLEIGFGGGEHLAHQAGLNRHVGHIGCEPYLNGVAGLLKHVDDHRLDNIRIYADDARLLMAHLPEASITRVFLLYPDPWPKARHRKRRLVNAATLDQIARILKPGGELRLATDDEDYCAWMLEHLLAHPAFAWRAEACADWLTPPAGWITTRYEQKKAVNRGLTPSYLNFIKKYNKPTQY